MDWDQHLSQQNQPTSDISYYLKFGVRYYLLQSSFEMMFMGIFYLLRVPLPDINPFGYFLAKTFYYGWLYMLAFVILNYLGRSESERSFSIVNAVLSIGFVLLLFIGMSKAWGFLIAVTLACILTGISSARFFEKSARSNKE